MTVSTRERPPGREPLGTSRRWLIGVWSVGMDDVVEIITGRERLRH